MTDDTSTDILRARHTRRALLGRALALGATTTLLGTLLAACGAKRGASASGPTAAADPAPSTPMQMPALGTTTPAASPVTGTTQVTIQNFAFAPAALRVPVGTDITWTNADEAPHTVTAQDRAFTSDALDTGASYSHTFTAPGVYAYYCAIHPVMTGQVIVQ